ncbi:hypothetical protein HpHNI39_10600 [Helicobacter pylori]
MHGKTIESFDDPKNYPPITLPPLQTTVEIEKHRKNTTFDQNYTFHFIFDVSNNFYFYKYIDILYQRGFLYTDRRLKE